MYKYAFLCLGPIAMTFIFDALFCVHFLGRHRRRRRHRHYDHRHFITGMCSFFYFQIKNRLLLLFGKCVQVKFVYVAVYFIWFSSHFFD